MNDSQNQILDQFFLINKIFNSTSANEPRLTFAYY